MKFLVDRCAGALLTEWLAAQGHDAVYAPALGPDPGDAVLLQWSNEQGRILVTIDKDFGTLVYTKGQSHSGLIRLPDVPAQRRIEIMEIILKDHGRELVERAVVTVRGERIRVSRHGAQRPDEK